MSPFLVASGLHMSAVGLPRLGRGHQAAAAPCQGGGPAGGGMGLRQRVGPALGGASDAAAARSPAPAQREGGGRGLGPASYARPRGLGLIPSGAWVSWRIWGGDGSAPWHLLLWAHVWVDGGISPPLPIARGCGTWLADSGKVGVEGEHRLAHMSGSEA